MRMCDDHWNELKKKLDDRGLTQFIAKDGKEAVERFVEDLQALEKDKKNFDPLLFANNAIMFNVLDTVGLAVMGQDENGNEHCPICYVINTCPCRKDPKPGIVCTFTTWTTHAANDALEEAKKLGLVAMG